MSAAAASTAGLGRGPLIRIQGLLDGDASPLRAAIPADTLPPWPPSADCSTYKQDGSLDDARKALLTRYHFSTEVTGMGCSSLLKPPVEVHEIGRSDKDAR